MYHRLLLRLRCGVEDRDPTRRPIDRKEQGHQVGVVRPRLSCWATHSGVTSDPACGKLLTPNIREPEAASGAAPTPHLHHLPPRAPSHTPTETWDSSKDTPDPQGTSTPHPHRRPCTVDSTHHRSGVAVAGDYNNRETPIPAAGGYISTEIHRVSNTLQWSTRS